MATVSMHPSYLEKDGKREFVVLPIEEFEELQAYLEDLEDLLELRQAKAAEGDAPTVSLEEIKRRLGKAAF